MAEKNASSHYFMELTCHFNSFCSMEQKFDDVLFHGTYGSYPESVNCLRKSNMQGLSAFIVHSHSFFALCQYALSCVNVSERFVTKYLKCIDYNTDSTSLSILEFKTPSIPRSPKAIKAVKNLQFLFLRIIWLGHSR